MKSKNNEFPFLKTTIEQLPPAAKGCRDTYYDTKMPHLCLRVTDSGTKSFVVIRRFEERTLKRTLGRFPAMTVEQARKVAEKVNASLSQGVDPLEERRRKRSEMTFAELFQIYLERHGKVHCKTSTEMEATYRRYLQQFGPRKVNSLTRGELQWYHGELGSKHGRTSANRAIELIKAIINKGRFWGLISCENPAAGLQKFRLKSRKRFLRGEELPRFFEALAEEPNEDIRDFILMCLLTGARKTNVLEMRWENISLVDEVWHIPVTKNGESQEVPLVDEAVRLMKRRWQNKWSDWVFPSFGKTGHLVEVKGPWDRLLKRAGIVDLHIHDLRRTLGSWQARTGASLLIIGQTLNHKDPKSTMIYARLATDPIRDAMTTATTAMFETAKELRAKRKREADGPGCADVSDQQA